MVSSRIGPHCRSRVREQGEADGSLVARDGVHELDDVAARDLDRPHAGSTGVETGRERPEGISGRTGRERHGHELLEPRHDADARGDDVAESARVRRESECHVSLLGVDHGPTVLDRGDRE